MDKPVDHQEEPLTFNDIQFSREAEYRQRIEEDAHKMAAFLYDLHKDYKSKSAIRGATGEKEDHMVV